MKMDKVAGSGNDELNDILDAFADQRLEGEEVYVVLPNDLI